MKGFTFNKALGAGLGGLVFGTFGPALLGLLHAVQPVAAGVNPLLGALVGLTVAAVTWLSPKNVEQP